MQTVQVCPECRKKIAARNAPNRILVNMASEVKYQCSDCGWTGTREQSRRHTDCAATAAAGGGRSVSPQAAQYPPQQQQANYHAYAHQASVQNAPLAFQQPRQNQEVIPVAAGGSTPWVQYGLSQMEYDQIFCIFLHFDADGSGELDKKELKKLARWLNFAHTDKDIDEMFRQMDSDRSGSLSLDEFCSWLKHNRPDPQSLYGMSQSDYNYVLMQFHHYDDDSTGELTKRQFVELCVKCDLASSREEAATIFEMIDQDRSGTVDLHEFLTFRAQQNRAVSAYSRGGPQGSGAYGQQQPQPQPHASGAYYPQGSQGSYGNQSGNYGSGAYVQPQQQSPQQRTPPQQQQWAPAQPQPQPPSQPGRWQGPPGWEQAFDPQGRPYYIDHNTKRTQWHPPQW